MMCAPEHGTPDQSVIGAFAMATCSSLAAANQLLAVRAGRLFDARVLASGVTFSGSLAA